MENLVKERILKYLDRLIEVEQDYVTQDDVDEIHHKELSEMMSTKNWVIKNL